MKRIELAMLLSVALFGAGCSIHLDPRVPHDLAPRRDGLVETAPAARGMPARAGWGTFTVFAIPVAPVHVDNGPGERIIMDKLKDTLAQAGYHAANTGTTSDGPVLECNVKRFSFRNYTYFFPLVFTWGGVDLDMRLAGRDGRVLWQRSYSGDSSNLAYSFTGAANQSMEQALNKFGRDATSEEFFRACCQRPATPQAAP